MERKEAIMAFSQSEKIKVGLIWVSQIFGLMGVLDEGEKQGAAKVLDALINMIGHEIGLAKQVAGIEGWNEIFPHLERAAAMVRSGVGQEANIHISKALSIVTNTGQRSMSFLQEQGLL